jgi:tetratricopeptide (TPR) repeat protein
MTASPKPDPADRNLATIDRIVSAFDRAVKRGAQPKIEDYLRETPATVKAQVLASLLRIEMEEQCKRGTTISPVQNYLARFPEHPSQVTAIYREIVTQTAPQEPATGWFYLRHQRPVGPFAFDQLQKLAVAGDLRPRDLVCQQSNPEWREAASINDLFSGAGNSKETKAPESGQWIKDDYVLLEQVGRGGMGEVYKAYRFSLKKEVAVKIIRRDRFHHLAAAKQQQILICFQKEMQATAKLRHENIVAIHDTGDHNGLPFYTMDFVEATLIHVLRQGPLPSRKAAEIMEKIARAAACANEQGIIHRDIKPHNILLDKEKPLLTDLGLATVHEELLEGKQQREIAGTPPYMAPEQVLAGKVDARTDVYGLGATLYHLITGRPPHQGATSEKTFRQVLDVEPMAPRKLDPTIDADLESITLKCLEKEPEKRYRSATALAEDLQKYLEGRSIDARRPTLRARLKKWSRREPIKAGLLGSVGLLLFVLLTGGAIYNRLLSGALEEARVAEKKADDQFKLADEAKNEAEQERKKATALADVLANRVLNRVKREDSLDEAIANLEKDRANIERLLKDTPFPAIKLDLAETLRNLYLAYQGKGRFDEAAKALAECVVLQEELVHEMPALGLELALNYIDLGSIYLILREFPRVFECDSKAVARLQDMRKQRYNQPIILESLATAHLMVGLDYIDKDDKENALKHQVKAVDILEQLMQAHEPGRSVQSTERQLGSAYEKAGITMLGKDGLQAMAYLQKAKHIFDDKTQYRRNLADVYFSLGKAYSALKQPEQAQASMLEARKIIVQMWKEIPGSPQVEPLRLQEAEIISFQALTLQDTEPKKAEELYNRSRDIRQELYEKQPARYQVALAVGYSHLGGFQVRQKNWPEAINQLDRAVPLLVDWLKKSPRDFDGLQVLGVVLHDKGVVLFNRREFAQAKVQFQSAKKPLLGAFELAEHGNRYGNNLNLTFRMLVLTQRQLNEFAEALMTIDAWLQIWPTDAKYTWDVAKELAGLCPPGVSGKVLEERLIPLLKMGLTKELWTAEQVRNEPAFQTLRDLPAFKAMLDGAGG